MQAALCALLVSSPAAAGGTNGATPFNFLFLDANARAVALGGAYAAIANDANALLCNPAGLGALQGHELTLMHDEYFQGITQEYGAFAYNIGEEQAEENAYFSANHRSQGWGLMVNTLDFGSIQRTTLSNPDGNGLGDFGIRDWAFAAGYGVQVVDGLSVGVAAKGLSESIDDVRFSAPAADLGLLYRLTVIPVSLGAAVQNIGPAVQVQFDQEPLPLNARLGLAYRIGQAGVLTIEGDQPRDGSATIGAGAEYTVLNRLALRLGYSSRNDAATGVTMGFGLRISGASVDYAFVPYGDLGDAQRISLSFRWGGRRAAAPTLRGASDAAPPPYTDAPQEHFSAAQALIAAKSYDQARVELDKAAALLLPDDRRRLLYEERMGSIALIQHDCNQAVSYYQEFLKLSESLGLREPPLANIYAGLGLCLARQGDTEQASQYLRKSLELSPSAATRALVERKLGELKGSEAAPYGAESPEP